jgi:hypothetical protein
MAKDVRERSQEMKIEAGKAYRMRNGRKAIVHWQAPNGDWHGSFFVEDTWYAVLVWDCNGSGSVDDFNLVAEWEESKPRMIALVDTCDGSVHMSGGDGVGMPSHWTRAPWLDEPEEGGISGPIIRCCCVGEESK